MNTYIQDKLDEEIVSVYSLIKKDALTEQQLYLYTKGLLTDYHNHIMKYLKVNHIDHCIQQNGLPYCKNCGLDLTEMEHDLSLLQGTNPKE